MAAAAYYLNELNSEKPEYDLLVGEGKLALRRYPALTVAETVQSGQRETAMGNGFRVLADYIFARSRPGDKIAMTVPVLSLPAEDGSGWLTRFVMPAKLDRGDLPLPSPGMAIGTIPERTLAAIRFGGSADDALLHEREAELREWMAGRGLEPAGPPEYAFYNSPFIPGPLRRTEILIPVS